MNPAANKTNAIAYFGRMQREYPDKSIEFVRGVAKSK
jgi:predicted SnoaL-like aldol condensation-catalyzing enzyme